MKRKSPVLLACLLWTAWQSLAAAGPGGAATSLPVRGLHVLAPAKKDVPAALEFIRQTLPREGVNTLVMEFGYSYNFRSLPEFANPSALDANDVGKLAAACRAGGIELIPEINCLGHQSWAAHNDRLLQNHPEFDETPGKYPGNKGIYCRSYCPLHPEVHTVLLRLIDELAKACEAKAFHAGMDEVFILADPNCPRCGGKDPAELFAGEVTKLHSHLKSIGCRMWMWGDRFLDGKATKIGQWEASTNGTHRAIDLVPKDIVICDWHYGKAYDTARFFADKGFQVVSCPWRNAKVGLDQLAQIRVFRAGAEAPVAGRAMGMLQTTWCGFGEFVHAYRRLDAGAAQEKSQASEAAGSFRALFEAVRGLPATAPAAEPAGQPALTRMDEALARIWLARWEKNIVADSRNRYCDKETGEELGWLVSPFVNGFYYGYLATGDTRWVDRLIDWSDAVIKRGVKEPDGFVGWPKAAGASTGAMPDFTTDNQLGEAMLLRPMVLMAGEILKAPALKAKYGRKAEEYIRLSEQVFQKWDARGAWREVKTGGVWVVPPFGLDAKAGQWTADYDLRNKDGFTLPANKQNLVACWLTAMYDVTGKGVYRERAEKWWRVMKSRMRPSGDGKCYVWNYWDPAGPWDRKPDGSLKHWVGVHPNGGYYDIDVEGIVTAYEHGLVFTKEDIARLVATNRDYMWDKQVAGAKFQRIDGGEPDKRWAKSPGVLWSALAPYDATLRKVFEANHDPAGWGGLSSTPSWLARFARRQGPAR